ncbi:DUF3313 domain-containing protein [Desulfomicrobium salsuginis]
MKKIILVALLFSLCACATGGKQSATDFNPADHFLGADYAKLQENPDLKGGLGWRNTAFSPATYSALYIEPVVLWQGEDMARESGLKMADLKLLATYFHDVLTQVPDGKALKLSSQPGPGVIAVKAAVTEVEASSPVSNALTSVVPVGIILSAGMKVATGQAVGVGKCAVEIRFVDSVTGETLAMFADTKVGKKYDTAGFTKTGQSEEAMNEWAALLKERIDVVWGRTK